jgi:hypothetical protein
MDQFIYQGISMPEYLHTFKPQDDAVKPQDVKFLLLKASPLAEPQKIRVIAQLTPFLQLPDFNFSIKDDHDLEVASVSMIESVLDELNFVMHIRKTRSELPGYYQLHAEVVYRDIGIVDEQTISFEVVI